MKRLAVTTLYPAQGGTEDEAATVLGISKSRVVVYINEMLDVLDNLSKRFVRMPVQKASGH